VRLAPDFFDHVFVFFFFNFDYLVRLVAHSLHI
jgi:hypothetical protein